jgi:spermidine/putrescine transport system ATP-binding protein
LAGLERPTEGKIYIEGKCINEVPPHKREIGMVVQSYALFPHMTVFENVAYGLRVRRVGAEELKERVLEALDLVHLSGYVERYPRALSGGEQQRCALARALVINPRVLLLDEALGALDKNLREEMQVELKQLQRRVGVTTVHVTHDQEEALGMSDRIVVLNRGSVEQFGKPIELYDKPQTEFVASFIGDANIFRTKVEEEVQKGILRVSSDDGYDLMVAAAQERIVPGSMVLAVVRPEWIEVSVKPPEQQGNVFEGVVSTVVYHGNSTKLVVDLDGGRQLIVHEPSMREEQRENLLATGDHIWVFWLPNAISVVKVE